MKNWLSAITLLITTCYTFTADHNNRVHKPVTFLFYWNAKPILGFSNFGDELSAALVERMLAKHTLHKKVYAISYPETPYPKLLGMGSILKYARNNDIVWGTGINGKDTDDSYKFTTLDVRAVRGPLTRELPYF